MLRFVARRWASSSAVAIRSHQTQRALVVGETWSGAFGSRIEEVVTKPSPIPDVGDQDVRQVSCGWGHTAVAHPDGRVSMMGRPSDFRNVLKHINTYNRWPALQRAMRACTRVMFPADNGCNELKHPIPGRRFVDVQAGAGSLTAFRDDSGAVFMMGHNFFGQCGIGDHDPEIVYAPSVPVTGIDPEPEDQDYDVTNPAIHAALVASAQAAADAAAKLWTGEPLRPLAPPSPSSSASAAEASAGTANDSKPSEAAIAAAAAQAAAVAKGHGTLARTFREMSRAAFGASDYHDGYDAAALAAPRIGAGVDAIGGLIGPPRAPAVGVTAGIGPALLASAASAVATAPVPALASAATAAGAVAPTTAAAASFAAAATSAAGGTTTPLPVSPLGAVAASLGGALHTYNTPALVPVAAAVFSPHWKPFSPALAKQGEAVAAAAAKAAKTGASPAAAGAALVVAPPASLTTTGLINTDEQPIPARVVQVACGFEHALAVTAHGRLYSWGRGNRGQLGHGDKDAYMKAARVLGPGELFLGLEYYASRARLVAHRRRERRAAAAAANGGRPAAGGAAAGGGAGASASGRAPGAAFAAASAASSSSSAGREAPPPDLSSLCRVTGIATRMSTSACITQAGDLFVWGKMAALTTKKDKLGGSLMADQAVPRRVFIGEQAEEEAQRAMAESVVREAAAGGDNGADAAAGGGGGVAGSEAARTLNGVVDDELETLPVTPPPAALASAAAAAASGRFLLPPSFGYASSDPLATIGAAGDGDDDQAHAPTGILVRPAHCRVIGVTMGQAHTCFLTADGRIWMIGLRGRGRIFDDSDALLTRWARAAASGSPAHLVLGAHVGLDVPFATRNADGTTTTTGEGGSGSGDSGVGPGERRAGLLHDLESALAETLAAHQIDLAAVRGMPSSGRGSSSGGGGEHASLLDPTLSVDLPLPDMHMQTVPMEVPVGPLAGHTVVALRSDDHFSYAVTSGGRVFRWGWKGIVLPYAPSLGHHVTDLSFGFKNAVLVVRSGSGSGGGGSGHLQYA